MSEFVKSINLFDLLVLVIFFTLFILGFIQGVIRRVVGILSILFSFFLAAQLQVPLGSFLGDHWRQFPREYGAMIGFLAVFAAAVIAFALVIQGTYRKAPLFAKYPVLEEIVGGLLGVLEGVLVLMLITIILDQFFLIPNVPVNADEAPFLRDAWNAINTSGTGAFLHGQLIPNFIAVTWFLMPESIRLLYGKG